MFGTTAGGENPGPGQPEQNWAQCLVDARVVFLAAEGSTERFHLVFGTETVLRYTADTKGRKCIEETAKQRIYCVAA